MLASLGLRRRGATLLSLVLVATALTSTRTLPASAEPDAELTFTGFDAVTDGETSDGTLRVELADRTGLGVDHPLRVALTLTTRDGDPVRGQELTATIAGTTLTTTTDDDGLALVPPADTGALALRDTSAMLGGGLDVDLRTQLDEGRHVLLAQLVDWEGPLRRRDGATRVETAVAATRAAFGPGTDTVYVATADAFPDALAGGAAAARLGSPVMLTRRDVLPDTTRAELTRLTPRRIVVLGGPDAVDDAVLAELDDLATEGATRQAGDTRVETATTVSSSSWPEGADTVVVANAGAFPDALAGGAMAADLDAPVLLVGRDDVPEATAAELRRLDPDEIVAVGGELVISEAGLAALADLDAGDVRRVAGGDRYATATAAAADTTRPDAGGVLVVATGADFPDALAGVALAGATGGTLLLTEPGRLRDDVRAAVERLAPDRIELLGGEVAVTAEVETALGELVDDPAVTRARRIREPATTDVVVLPVDGGPTPEVDITDPTAADPTEVVEGADTSVTFTTTEPGTFDVFLRRTGSGDAPTVVRSGDAPADEPVTVAVGAPTNEGSYDVLVAVTTDEEARGSDAETGALVVTDDPAVPDVEILSPTGDDPEIATGGQSFDLVFEVDRAGTWVASYGPSGSATYTPFPGGAGTVDEPTGATVTRTFQAPALSDLTTPVYDLKVEFVAAGAPVVDDVEEAALVVTPLPSAIGASRACRLGGETPQDPAMTGMGGDPLDPAHCLLPFPNDLHTRPVATPGLVGDNPLRVNLLATAMPRNRAGKLVDPTEWNRNDGFSPASIVMTVVPGLDLARTWDPDDPSAYADLVTTPSRSLAADAPIVLVDLTTGERHPFWAELDAHPTTLAEGWERTLLIRPLVQLTEGHRYGVALRDLRDADGDLIPAGDAFTYYRDAGAANPFPGDPGFAARRGHIRQVLDDIEAVTDVDRATDEVFLAWDFTVASGTNLAGRLLHIRDDAFETLGDTNLADGVVDGDAPELRITQVEVEDGEKLLTVTGELTIPLYLREPQSTDIGIPDFPGCDDLPDPLDVVCGTEQSIPGARFFYATPGAEHPSRNPFEDSMQAEFVCNLPASALVDGVVDPSRVALYGHGLLGSKGESEGSSTGAMRREQNQTHCALDWFGFASEDIGNIAAVLTDYSNFPSVADRVQQGFLNWQFLARAVVHPDGLLAATAPDGSYPFRLGGTADGEPLIDTSKVVYEGNSQGGILGGGLLAIAPDVRRGVLGVPATNYSTLLNRSVDWEGSFVEAPFPDPLPQGLGYADVYYSSYPDKVDQQVGFALLQMLWDRAEGGGYAQHTTTDPYPNTPTHQVLLHPAWGDYQVANVAAEVQARTYGAAYLAHALEPGLHWAGDEELFGFTALEDDPSAHSAIVYWDSGNPAPPNLNVPPEDFDQDPHSDPRKDPNSAVQRAAFLDTGVVVDVLPGQPYHTDRFPNRACNDAGVDPRGICPE